MQNEQPGDRGRRKFKRNLALPSFNLGRMASPNVTWPRHPKRCLGQHFLRDPKVIERIVAAIAPYKGQHIVEIGPGTGALTVPLLHALGKLDVVELDRKLATELAQRCSSLGTLRIHAVDALRFSFCSLVTDQKIRLVGNLPYYISTPFLFHVFTQLHCIEDMVFMLQREVAERLAANPGTRQYGRLTVMVQYRCRVEVLFRVSPKAFYPPPKVESSVVKLMPRYSPAAVIDPAILNNLVNRAFSQRRKTLRNSLRGIVDENGFREVGLDSTRRAEALTVDQFILLANQVATASRKTSALELR